MAPQSYRRVLENARAGPRPRRADAARAAINRRKSDQPAHSPGADHPPQRLYRADTVEQQSRQNRIPTARGAASAPPRFITALHTAKTALSNSIEHLRAFESDYHTHLTRFLNQRGWRTPGASVARYVRHLEAPATGQLTPSNFLGCGQHSAACPLADGQGRRCVQSPTSGLASVGGGVSDSARLGGGDSPA